MTIYNHNNSNGLLQIARAIHALTWQAITAVRMCKRLPGQTEASDPRVLLSQRTFIVCWLSKTRKRKIQMKNWWKRAGVVVVEYIRYTKQKPVVVVAMGHKSQSMLNNTYGTLTHAQSIWSTTFCALTKRHRTNIEVNVNVVARTMPLWNARTGRRTSMDRLTVTLNCRFRPKLFKLLATCNTRTWQCQ